MISEEAFILPRGALFKRYDAVIVENRAFEGLNLLECDELRSYLHYRRPHEKWNTNLLTRKDYNYAIDFLDTIESDKPSGTFIWNTVVSYYIIKQLNSFIKKNKKPKGGWPKGNLI